MTVKSSAIEVTVVATRLDTVGDGGALGKSIAVLVPAGEATIFVGGPDVTAAEGVPVAAGEWGPTLDLDEGESLWAVTEAGTSSVRVLERGV